MQQALNICQRPHKSGLAIKLFWLTNLDAVSPGDLMRTLRKMFFTPKELEEARLYGFETSGPWPVRSDSRSVTPLRGLVEDKICLLSTN